MGIHSDVRLVTTKEADKLIKTNIKRNGIFQIAKLRKSYNNYMYFGWDQISITYVKKIHSFFDLLKKNNIPARVIIIDENLENIYEKLSVEDMFSVPFFKVGVDDDYTMEQMKHSQILEELEDIDYV